MEQITGQVMGHVTMNQPSQSASCATQIGSVMSGVFCHSRLDNEKQVLLGENARVSR